MQQHDAMIRAALDRIVAALDEAREELDELDAVAEAPVETPAIEARIDGSPADLGDPDPGAPSTAVILAAIAEVVAEF